MALVAACGDAGSSDDDDDDQPTACRQLYQYATAADVDVAVGVYVLTLAQFSTDCDPGECCHVETLELFDFTCSDGNDMVRASAQGTCMACPASSPGYWPQETDACAPCRQAGEACGGGDGICCAMAGSCVGGICSGGGTGGGSSGGCSPDTCSGCDTVCSSGYCVVCCYSCQGDQCVQSCS